MLAFIRKTEGNAPCGRLLKLYEKREIIMEKEEYAELTDEALIDTIRTELYVDEANADARLNPPHAPSTSSTSPQAKRPLCFFDIIVLLSNSLTSAPPLVTWASLKLFVPVTFRRKHLSSAAMIAACFIAMAFYVFALI